MDAIDRVNIEIDYSRPQFQFDDLSGEKGNPIIYWKEAINAIQRNGFKKEAKDILQYDTQDLKGIYCPKINYDEQFNYLFRFLDFSYKNEKISEDEEFIYLKVRKEKVKGDKATRQPTIFSIKNKDVLNDLLENGEDFSLTNCYGRTILHYAEDTSILNFLLEKNKEHNWIDLFSFDNFGGNLLHTQDNIRNFSIILEEMYKQEPDLAKQFFLLLDDFNRTPYHNYLYALDHLFCKKGQNDINTDDWNDFCQSLTIIKLIDPIIHSEIIENVKNIPAFIEFKGQNMNQHKNNSKYNAFMYLIMESSLAEKDTSLEPKKNKI